MTPALCYIIDVTLHVHILQIGIAVGLMMLQSPDYHRKITATSRHQVVSGRRSVLPQPTKPPEQLFHSACPAPDLPNLYSVSISGRVRRIALLFGLSLQPPIPDVGRRCD